MAGFPRRDHTGPATISKSKSTVGISRRARVATRELNEDTLRWTVGVNHDPCYECRMRLWAARKKPPHRGADQHADHSCGRSGFELPSHEMGFPTPAASLRHGVVGWFHALL